jgi:hypothetical protein
LQKRGITSDNVNNQLSKLRAINMPSGGKDVGDYIYEVDLDYLKIKNLNTVLSILLRNGIILMNGRNVYHCDIKESNVLVSVDEMGIFTRLIDWGLSVHYTGKQIPKPMVGRSFQYNTPFSTVFFNKQFIQMYNDFLKSTVNPDEDAIGAFVKTYVLYWVDYRGIGHLKIMNSIFKNTGDVEDMQYFSENIIKYQYAYSHIFKYLTQILIKYTNRKSKKVELLKYFTDVYLKNVDIWGFVMIYLPIMEYLQDNTLILNRYEVKLVDTIKKMILLLVENGADIIDVDKLMEYIAKLSELFINADELRKRTPIKLTNSKKKTKIQTKKLPSST